VLGLEADFSGPDKMFSNVQLIVPDVGPSFLEDKIQLWGSVRGRIGYSFDDWLVYATGGFAYTRDLASITDPDDNTENVRFWRRGWTAGGGVEVRLTPNWSAKLEYLYNAFGSAGIWFPSVGERYTSNLALHSVQLGLNYRFAEDPPAPVSAQAISSEVADWSIHGQSTFVQMTNPPFRSAYVGPNSLFPGYQMRETLSASSYLGHKLWEGTELYFNPELFQGFGLSATHGVAGFPNAESQKGGFDYPRYNTSRLFLRHIFGLGGEQEDLPDSANQVAETVDVSRLTLTFGKVAIPDLFDNNIYAHDGRSSFLNYALAEAATFDYAGDQIGFTWGAALDLNQKDWAFRAGYFLTSDVPNSLNYDTRLFRRGQYLVEFEERYRLFDAPGKLRLTGWVSRCFCGSFAATLAKPFLTDPDLNPDGPDIAATRETRTEFGFIANLEQSVSDDLGLFARLGWRNGQTEITSFTDADRTISFGGVVNGTSWGRPNDRVGLGGVINGLSGNYRAFLGIGGLGLIVGDGKLSYRAENVLEAYYSVGLTEFSTLTFDYQFVNNPGYNVDRGPVSIGALRLHVQF